MRYSHISVPFQGSVIYLSQPQIMRD